MSWRPLQVILVSIALIGCLNASERVIRWTECKGSHASFGKPKDGGHLGHWLKEVSWRGKDGESLRLQLHAQDFNTDGEPTKLVCTAKWNELPSCTTAFTNTEARTYPLFSVLGYSLNSTQLDGWRIWSLEVEGTTNGDPPNYFLWVVQGPQRKGIALGYGSGRGLMGFKTARDHLELVILGHGSDGPCVKLHGWGFTESSEGSMTAVKADDRYLFMLDGGHQHILSSIQSESAQLGLSCYGRAASQATLRGGLTEPSPECPDNPFPFDEVQGWKRLQDHYTSQFWADFNWAWDLTWHEGPARKMVAPGPDHVPFRWAKEIHVFQGEEPFDPYHSNVGPKAAARLAARPGWKVVLVKDHRVGAVAVGLVPAVAPQASAAPSR